jgi:hypothetical protein
VLVPPFISRPASEATEVARARLVAILVAIGIAAALIAYAISPSVRHAVSHAAHSVSNVLDHDKKAKKKHSAPGTVTVQTKAPSTGGG